jgi:hypothetical protein
MVNSLKTGKALKGSDSDLIKVSSQYSPRGTEENHENRTTGVLAEIQTEHL